MPNPNKAKGDKWERDVRDYVTDVGLRLQRLRASGVKDQGDLGGSSWFALECKDEASHDHHGYLRQARREAENSGKPFAAAIIKKRRANVSEALVCMTLADFAALLVELEERT